MVVDGEIYFHTSRCSFPKGEKRVVKSKSGEDLRQIPVWHEAFVLYFQKEGNSEEGTDDKRVTQIAQKEKQFSM